jgi:hypothetical protein
VARPLIDRVLTDARTIIADRQRRLRGLEAVTADGSECDPCAAEARRFCAVGALIRAAFDFTGDHKYAHSVGWQVAGMIADAARLRCVVAETQGGRSHSYMTLAVRAPC